MIEQVTARTDSPGAKILHIMGRRKRKEASLRARREWAMAKELQHEQAYYYDLHPTEEDLMGEAAIHRDLSQYIREVLRWQFRAQRYAIYENLNFYQTSNTMEPPIVPDIAVIKGADYRFVTSWKIGPGRPAPQVV